MQIRTGFRAASLPALGIVIGAARSRTRAVVGTLLRSIKAVGSRVNAVIAKPWFFPAQVAVLLAILWLQQHGYLQVPVTVCDWNNIGK